MVGTDFSPKFSINCHSLLFGGTLSCVQLTKVLRWDRIDGLAPRQAASSALVEYGKLEGAPTDYSHFFRIRLRHTSRTRLDFVNYNATFSTFY